MLDIRVCVCYEKCVKVQKIIFEAQKKLNLIEQFLKIPKYKVF